MIIDLSRRNLLECPKVEQWFNENLSTNKLSLNKLNLLIDNKKINFRNDIFYDIDLLDFDWKKSNNLDKNYWWALQSFCFVDWFSSSFDLQNEKVIEYTRYIEGAIINWYYESYNVQKESPLIWHDHATALRLNNSLNFLLVLEKLGLKKSLSNHFFKIINELFSSHIRFLSEEKFYSKNTNHGYDQSLILFKVCSFLNYSELFGIINLSYSRLISEIDYAFTLEGVHKENSPAYQKVMLGKLMEATALKKFLDDYGDFNISKLQNRVKDFMEALTLPDGNLPMIGDTLYPIKGINRIANKKLQIFEYLSSGYLIISGTCKYNKEFKLIVKNTHLSNYHRHDDDLSIYFFYNDELILGDCGLYSHEEDDVDRKFIRSYKAHCVPFVKDALPRRRREDLSEQPLSIKKTEGIYEFTSSMFGVMISRHIDFSEIHNNKFSIRDISNGDQRIYSNFVFNDKFKSNKVSNGFNVLSSKNSVSLHTHTYLGQESEISDYEINEIPYSERYKVLKTGHRLSFDSYNSVIEFSFSPNGIIENNDSNKSILENINSRSLEESSLDYKQWSSEHFIHYSIDEFLENIELNGIHSLRLEGIEKIDFYIRDLKKLFKKNLLLVGFHAAISERKIKNKKAPFFSGIGISEQMNLPFIGISDPSLAISQEIDLGWHLGTSKVKEFASVIGEILDTISMKYKKRCLLFGSSGGGFASLNVSRFMNSKAIVLCINPQTNIFKFNYKMANNYFKIVHGEIITNDKNKEKLLQCSNRITPKCFLNLNEIKDNIDLIYLQNLKDTPHLFKQAIPFFLDKFTAELDRGFFLNGKNKYLLILNWGEGQSPAPKEIIKSIINKVSKQTSLRSEVHSFYSDITDYHISNELHFTKLIRKLDLDFNYSIDGKDLKFEIMPNLSEIYKDKVQFAYYLYCGTHIIKKLPYSYSTSFSEYIENINDTLEIKVFLKDSFGFTRSTTCKIF